MYDAERPVTILDRIDDDADRRQIVDGREVAALDHLLVNRIEMFRPTRHFGFDAGRPELGDEFGDDARDGVFARGALLGNPVGDVAVRIGIEVA